MQYNIGKYDICEAPRVCVGALPLRCRQAFAISASEEATFISAGSAARVALRQILRADIVDRQQAYQRADHQRPLPVNPACGHVQKGFAGHQNQNRIPTTKLVAAGSSPLNRA